MGITHASQQGTIVVRCGARQRVVTLSGGSPRLEERDFTNALINVLRESEPKICFLSGHRERDIDDEDGKSGASMLKNLLQGESYKAEKFLVSSVSPQVPKDCEVLVIDNPAGDLQAGEIGAIDEYLSQGGRLFVMLDPWKGIKQGVAPGEHLRPWLEQRFGIKVGSDIVITDKLRNVWQVELNTDPKPFEGINTGFGDYRGCFRSDHPITRNFEESMLLQACRTVSAAQQVYQGVTTTELLRTPPYYWAETDVAKLAQTGQATKNSEEASGPLSLAVAAVAAVDPGKAVEGRPHDLRVVVIGDSDFTTNEGLGVPGHLNFVLNAFAWLTEREELIAIRPSAKTPPPLLLSPMQQRAVAWISILLTVQVVVAAGLAVYWLRRKNR
jgi:hypothetical protein